MKQTERRTPGQRAGLAQDLVLREARRLAREKGAERLTMRELASRLGVAPNALYSYFPDKSALLDALLDALLGEIETDDLDAIDWRDGLVELMRRSRRLLLDHADLLPHFMARPTRGPNAIRLGEETLALLERAGLSGDDAVESLRILLVYTFGFVALEAPRRSEPNPDDRRALSAAAFRTSTERPRMAALGVAIASSASDVTFDRGLGWLIEGITLAARRSAVHPGS